MSMIGNYRRVSVNQLHTLLSGSPSISDFLFASESPAGMYLDIDKSWHAIHFLLTGSDWDGELPLGNVVLGGHLLSEEDLGYGPVRYLMPEEVQAVASALENISPEELSSRFDVNALNKADIYPQIWDENQDALDYVLFYYEKLVDFFAMTAKSRDAMLIYLH